MIKDKSNQKFNLVNLINNTMDKNSKKIAIIKDNNSITYGELKRKSISVAEYISKELNLKNANIAFEAKREIETYILLLGIIFSGNTFIPINEKWPDSRKQNVLKRCSALLLDYNKINLENNKDDLENSINEIIYIIFTSGSTGEPKGVKISQDALANTIISVNELLRLNKQEKMLAISDLSFDLSMYDFFGTLLLGGQLILLSYLRLEEIMSKLDNITLWNSVPMILDSFLNYALVNNPNYKNLSIKNIVLSGDKIPISLIKKSRKIFPNAEIYSFGGATEGTIWSIYFPIKSDNYKNNIIPYGYPLKNQEIFVLNKNLEPVKENEKGIIYIGGRGLALGYFDDELETDNKFIYTEKYGRIYNTGDYGTYDIKNNITYIWGRADKQIKLNGNRIEIEDIENVFLNFPKILDVVVTIDEFKNIILIYKSEERLNEEDLLDFAKENLPKYMIPRKFIEVDEFELTQNGKKEKHYINMKLNMNDNSVKNKIILIWQEVLHVEDVALEDDFFEKGGDSLKAQIMIKRIEKEINIQLDIRSLLNDSTLGNLINIIENSK